MRLGDISPIRSLIEQLRRVRVMKYETKPQGQTDQTSGFAAIASSKPCDMRGFRSARLSCT
jgi:hypothetical protein